jgi:hypothetical protein
MLVLRRPTSVGVADLVVSVRLSLVAVASTGFPST